MFYGRQNWPYWPILGLEDSVNKESFCADLYGSCANLRLLLESGGSVAWRSLFLFVGAELCAASAHLLLLLRLA